MTDLLLGAVIFDCITHIAKRRNTRIEVDILGVYANETTTHCWRSFLPEMWSTKA